MRQFISMFLGGLVLSLCASTLSACHRNTPTAAEERASISRQQNAANITETALAEDEIALISDDITTAKAERYQPTTTVTGTLQSAEQTTVQSTVNAQVQQVLTDVGAIVEKGQALVILDIADTQNQLAQAEADVAAAEAQANVAETLAQKNKMLLDKGFVAQIEYERSAADATAQQQAVIAKRAQLANIKKRLGDTTIKAPADGVIASRSVDVGQVVAPNQTLMQIINPDKLEFAANVPSEAQNQISIGQSVPFSVGAQADSINQDVSGATLTEKSTAPYVGQISRIAPQVDPTSRQLTIYVAVRPDKDLRAGMFATGTLPYGQVQIGVLLPAAAVRLKTVETTPSASTVSPIAPPVSPPSSQSSGMVWVIGQDHRLRHQTVTIIRHDAQTNQYLVSGIEAGTVVTTVPLLPKDAGKRVVVK